jgi:hypothetical protein
MLLLSSVEKGGTRVGSFQSLAECEVIRADLIAAAHRPFGDPWMVPDQGDPVRIAQATVWGASRCVPRDEPTGGLPTNR